MPDHYALDPTNFDVSQLPPELRAGHLQSLEVFNRLQAITQEYNPLPVYNALSTLLLSNFRTPEIERNKEMAMGLIQTMLHNLGMVAIECNEEVWRDDPDGTNPVMTRINDEYHAKAIALLGGVYGLGMYSHVLLSAALVMMEPVIKNEVDEKARIRIADALKGQIDSMLSEVKEAQPK